MESKRQFVKQEFVKQESIKQEEKPKKKLKQLKFLTDEDFEQTQKSDCNIYTKNKINFDQVKKEAVSKCFLGDKYDENVFGTGSNKCKKKEQDLEEVMELIREANQNDDSEVNKLIESCKLKTGSSKKKTNKNTEEKKLLESIEFHDTLALALTSSDVINTGSDLDIVEDIPFVETNTDKEIEIKVKYLYEIGRFKIKMKDPIVNIIPMISAWCKEDPTSLILCLDGKLVDLNDTPIKLDIGIADILECFKTTKKSAQSNEKNSNILSLKVIDNKSRTSEIIKINKLDTFHKLMNEYAKIKNIQISNLSFEYDGDKLKPDDTPMDLDIEDECQIDVKIK